MTELKGVCLIILFSLITIFGLEHWVSKTYERIATAPIPADLAIEIPSKPTPAMLAENHRVKELYWLAMTVCGEARSESPVGKLMVQNVILNRVKSTRFPNTVEEVVKQSSQFSMWNKGNVNGPAMIEAFAQPQYSDVVLECLDVARSTVEILPPTSLHYHTKHVSPSWNKKMAQYEVVGEHIFYKN